MPRSLRLTKFRHLSIADPFFDSLKAGYDEFPDWFARKADEDVYVVDDNGKISGMVYLKLEEGEVDDVTPTLPAKRWMKLGTLKIEGRGTRLGERVIKKIFDTAIAADAEAVYVTVFELHASLIDLFKRYGFVEYGTKVTKNGTELVLVRNLDTFTGDIIKDYPFVKTSGAAFWLLAIYPKYHTRLLPDSILNNESIDMVEDVSPTNTIHKVYISGKAPTALKRGDIIVFYRTNDNKGPARFRSVATSICVVEEVKRKRDFANFAAFHAYSSPRSVFDDNELLEFWNEKKTLSVIKMTYNLALPKRPTRGALIDSVGITEQPQWDIRKLTQSQFNLILSLGQSNARFIIN